VQEEFEQLLEAEWAGKLSEAQGRRLDALCAAHPELAEQLRKERQLNGLLAKHGPNHAPHALARAVLDRLDLETKESQKLATINIAGVIHKGTEPRPRHWAEWWPMLRWGLTTMV
jgi:hypothetical protein